MIVAATALMGLAASASASAPGADGLIAYAGRTGVNSFIAVANADGSGKRILVSDGYPDDSFGQPTWSPDGRQIAFGYSYQVTAGRFSGTVVVVNADGSGQRGLQTPVGDFGGDGSVQHPKWSPDGRLIAARSACDGKLANYDAQTGALGWTRAYAGLAGGLAWAPDSWRLAVETSSGIKVDNGTTITTVIAAGGLPDWSPDGASIFYNAVRGGHLDIFSAPAGGGAASARTATPAIDEYGPAVSPSGTQLAWTQGTAVMKRAVAGGAVTTVASDAFDPAWQPRAPRPVVGDPMAESTFVAVAADRARVTRFAFAAGVSQSISKLRAYVDGKGRTTGTQQLKGVIYADNAGRPGTLVASSNEIIVAANAAPAWRDLTFATLPRLASGTYWIGLLGGPTASVGRVATSPLIKRTSITGTDAYSDGPAPTFGTVITSQLATTSVYAYGGN